MVCITGACGFIGRHVTELLLNRNDYVYAVDALTYAADPTLPAKWTHTYGPEQIHFIGRNILALEKFPEIDAVINLAAETHVCNSITDNARFVETNIFGVQHLLEMCRAMRAYEMPRFIQIGTDEVYGSVTEGQTTEDAPLVPSSPYSATKAAADHLVQAWGHTYGVPWNIVRPSNCYGEHQYPEKLIPKAIRWATLGRAIPVHGDGYQTRSWLHVADCARAILTVLDSAPSGEVYNIGGNTEASVLDVLCLLGNATVKPGYRREGLDTRYAVSDDKLKSLGWRPQGNLKHDLPAIQAAELQRFRW